jgi:hypothetical protein
MNKIIISIAIIFLIVGTYLGLVYGATGFYIGESVDGMYKTCYYDCLGDTVAITIKAYKICPITIECP